jgi:hypothetical protein
MSYYKLLQVDIIQTSQLYLGGGVNAPLPSSGNVLYADGSGATFWSTSSGGTVSDASLLSTVASTVTSTIDGLGTLGYISTQQLLSTVLGLGNVFISTGTPGYGDVTSAELISTTIGLGNIYLSTTELGQVLSTQLLSTTSGLGQLYLSSPSLISTVDGLGSIGYISTSALTSTFQGLGQIYQSSPDVVLARHISTAVSTNFLEAKTIFAETETLNQLNVASILASTSVILQNAPLSLNYTATVPAFPLSITGPTTSAVNFRMSAGANNSLTMTVDGAQNAIITSEIPGVSRNPLIFNASYAQTNAISNIFTPTLLPSPNNTQIIGSTISTSRILGNEALFSSLIGDGSQLYNLSFVSTATMTSTIAGSLLTLNAVSTPTLASTVQGLPIYLGYLSSAGLGPIASTALVTASSVILASQIQTPSIYMSTTIGSSNLWVATGSAATPLATIEVSYDGITWSNITSGGFSVQANEVAWNGQLWVAVGTDATAANRIQTSTDGRTWTPASGAQFTGQGNFAAWNGRIWVAVGNDSTAANTIKYSIDGITWINSSGTGFTTGGNAVAWNGSMWVAVGTDSTAAARYSYDGISWQTGSGSFALTQNTVAWNGSYWLMGGTVNTAGNGIYYSKTGISWTSVSAPFQASVNGLAWNGTFWIVSATDNTATNTRYSYDGVTWTLTTGTTFASGGRAAGWSGRRWVQGGADVTQTSLLKYSDDGLVWADSIANNFTAITSVAFSANLIPFYEQENFRILPQNNPLFLNSTNTLFFSPTAAILNNTLYVDNRTERIGINCNAPSFDLDVYGSANVSSSVFASSFVGDGSRLTGLTFISSGSLISTVVGLGNIYLSSGNFSSALFSSFVSTPTLDASLASTTTNLINRIQTAAPVYASTNFSSIVANTLVISSINASTIFASTAVFSTMRTQLAVVSSLQFYEGDGFFRIQDLQTSNLSTVGLWASSVLTNAVITPNIFLGNNSNLSLLPFYGRQGNFTNSVLAEQSTGTTTQEFLMFRGSSSADQIRLQTTGQFVLETGVSARSWPTTTPQATPSLLIDINNNMNLGGKFYFDSINNRLGVNCNAPGVTLDVNGIIRGNGSLIFGLPALSTPPLTLSTSSMLVSSIITNVAIVDREFLSSLVVSSIAATTISTNTIFANQSFTSSVNTNALFTSTLSANTFYANTGFFSSFTTSSFSTAFINIEAARISSISFYDGDGFFRTQDLQLSNLSTVGLWASTLLTNTVRTSNIYLGQVATQTPIQFYGLRGNYTNTVIAEQSTGVLTQELLLFKGSSVADQVRIQTTGAFRLETGVSSRLWPEAPQETIPRLLVDTQGNFNFNNGEFYLDAPNNRVGINCNAPLFDLDITGTVRAQSSIFLSTFTSSLIANFAFVSSLTVSSIAFVNASTVRAQMLQTNTLEFSTINGTNMNLSSGFVSSLLFVSSLSATIAYVSTFSAHAASTLRLSTGTLFAAETSMSTLRASTMIAANFTTEDLVTSSIEFYNGPGYFFVTDIQTSNFSTITSYTSSLIANNVVAYSGISTQQIHTSSIIGNRITLNNSTPLFTLEVNGNARISSLTVDAGSGITSTNTTFSLAVWGAGGAARVGGTTWTQISDERIKKNIVEADYNRCYDDIKAIPLRRFTYISTLFDHVPLVDRNVLGFIAQEVSSIQPKSVTVSEAFGIDNLFWLNIDQLNMALYGAVKKLIQTNESLTSSFITLQGRVSTLEGER